MATVTLGSKAEGSIVKLKENGVLVEFYIAKQNYESGLNGSGRVLLVRKECYDQRQWHGSNVNAYATSAIDTWLNGTYKNLLDANIRNQMGETTFYYTPGNGNTTKTTLKRAVFLLSATELGQTHTCLNAEGTALSSTVLNLLKNAYTGSEPMPQWTRSPNTNYSISAWRLNASGDLYNRECSLSGGSRPAFTLPSTLYVNDDGSVFVNTAPSVPASISIPGSISGGTTITVSWGTSTDAESNLAGYKVEKSVNGGSSWSQIYQGTLTSTTDAVAFGTVSVMYRVKAYDTEGLESGYKTSSNITVTNNRAPSAPGSISVPETVKGGAALVISWAVSTDSDDNLSGYELERQYNGGSWSQIYRGAGRSYTDTITSGWQSVAYRVRAYDALNATSSYTTSPTRTVDNNSAPTISSDTASGTNLGIKTEAFDLTYTVADADKDTVTVKEYLDNVLQRSYTATLGSPNTFQAVQAANWQRVLNGTHTLKVVANDGKADSAAYTVTFEKKVTTASITLEEPLDADDDISIMVLNIVGALPVDANLQVLVTNNARDDAPVWEDATADIKAGSNHVFTNQTAAKGWAFNFKLTVSRGDSGQGGYITNIGGAFQ